MSKNTKKFNPKIKKYLILITMYFLFLFFILKIKHLNTKEISSKRNLEGTASSEESEKKTQICSKTSDNLKLYYKTGDKAFLGIDDDNINREDNQRINDLIKIVKVQFSTQKKDKTEELKDLIKNIMTYSKHILPLVILFVIAILSFPGWIVCCSLCCGDCCCCKCCVKTGCKLPSFIFSYIFYGIVAIVCFYGLGKYNSLFIGIADTECSIIKFVDDFVEGESKTNPPYWAGIDKISEILENLSNKIDQMNHRTPSVSSSLTSKENEITTPKSDFEGTLESKSSDISSNYKVSSNDYQLDVAKDFGTCDPATTSFAGGSVCELWVKEYKPTEIRARDHFNETKDTLTSILATDLDNYENTIGSLAEIKNSFKIIKETIAGNIIKKSDNYDKKGRLAFELLFSLLLVMDAGIATFMLLLCFCSGKICTCCGCTRCICKFFIHLLWNFMAMFMVALFLIGSLFTLFGAVGEDMMSVFAYLVSEENLGPDSDTILFGDVKQYLNKCFNNDGEILEELGFQNSLKSSFETLKSNELILEEINSEFKDKKKAFVYNEYLSEVNKRISYSTKELSLDALASTTDPQSIKFEELLEKINEKGLDKNERWKISSTSTEECSSTGSDANPIEYNPNLCYPTNKYWVNNEYLSDTSFVDAKNKLIEIKRLIEDVQDVSKSYSIKNILENDLGSKYQNFLDKVIEVTDEYISEIKEITNIVKNYNGEDEKMFTFINCKFIKSDIQVLIVNLKKALGEKMYTLGIYLLAAAFSLSFAISFTILLIMVINADVKKNQEEKMKKEEEIAELPQANSEGITLK